MSTALQSHESRLVVPDEKVAELLGICRRQVWTLNAREELPRPVRIGRLVRWSVEEIKAWLLAGAPRRSEWEKMRPEALGSVQ